MSLFSGVNNGKIKGPDVVINGDGGSLLPTTSSGIRFSSAQINQTPSLLSGIKPYSFGAGSTSDDITYGVNPHKIQKIVPTFNIPSWSRDVPDDMITMSHSVDDGDIAFTIRMVHDKNTYIKHWNYFSKQNITRAVDPIVNICTVNYILRGLQSDMGVNTPTWRAFLQSTGWPVDTDTFMIEDFQGGKYQHRNVSMFIQDYIRPLGVVIGSENQGGQHQGGGAVDFPVDFVVTILVDGLCDNMLNIWKRTEIRAGDDLFLALCGTKFPEPDKKNPFEPDHPVALEGETGCFEDLEPGLLKYQFSQPGDGSDGLIQHDRFARATADTTYVLNHWAKAQHKPRFTYPPRLLFGLIPTTSSEINEGYFLGDDRRNRGLWHIARSQVHIRGCPLSTSENSQTFRQDTENLKSGSLVQSTIAPVWKSATRNHAVMHGPGHFTWVSNVDTKHDDYEHPHAHKQFMRRSQFSTRRVDSTPMDFTGERMAKKARVDVSTASGLSTSMDIDSSTPTLVPAPEPIARRIPTVSSTLSVGEVRGKRSLLAEKKADALVGTDKLFQEQIQSNVVEHDLQGGIGVSGKVGTSAKVYARSMNSVTSEVASKPVSVARVSSKKRAEADISS